MKVETTRFGTLEIDDTSLIRMPRGPFGFEDYTDYIILQHRPDTSFRWLQSANEPSLAFVVVDPSQYFAGYEVEISDADAEALHLADEEDALVLSIVSFADGGKQINANLVAPLVINSKELIGMQVVLQDNRYGVKHALVEKAQQESNETTVLKAA